MKKPITINELIDKTRDYMGSDNFSNYSTSQHNCQEFVTSVLVANHLDTPKLLQFVKQDVKSIFEKLPGYAEQVANISTDIGAIINRAREGEGTKRRQKKIGGSSEILLSPGLGAGLKKGGSSEILLSPGLGAGLDMTSAIAAVIRASSDVRQSLAKYISDYILNHQDVLHFQAGTGRNMIQKLIEDRVIKPKVLNAMQSGLSSIGMPQAEIDIIKDYFGYRVTHIIWVAIKSSRGGLTKTLWKDYIWNSKFRGKAFAVSDVNRTNLYNALVDVFSQGFVENTTFTDFVAKKINDKISEQMDKMSDLDYIKSSVESVLGIFGSNPPDISSLIMKAINPSKSASGYRRKKGGSTELLLSPGLGAGLRRTVGGSSSLLLYPGLGAGTKIRRTRC
jgi:hypothetical protein